MEYSINQLSRLTGVSTRTFRYYDEIGLLKPLYVNEAGYRYYGSDEIDLLQQILFYRERGFALNKIKDILYKENFDKMAALYEHLENLKQQKERLSKLICTVNTTISSMKGEIKMNDKDKFEAFKHQAVKDNESLYGQEIRNKYGNQEIERSNKKFLNMTSEEYKQFEILGNQINEHLKNAVINGEKPNSEVAHKLVLMHKEWLLYTWPEYTKQAHLGLADMYISDERFKNYYDKEVEGCAQFLADVIKMNCLI